MADVFSPSPSNAPVFSRLARHPWTPMAPHVCFTMGPLVCFTMGPLVCFTMGPLVCSAMALLVCFTMASLVCSAMAPLVCFTMGPLVCSAVVYLSATIEKPLPRTPHCACCIGWPKRKWNPSPFVCVFRRISIFFLDNEIEGGKKCLAPKWLTPTNLMRLRRQQIVHISDQCIMSQSEIPVKPTPPRVSFPVLISEKNMPPLFWMKTPLRLTSQSDTKTRTKHSWWSS